MKKLSSTLLAATGMAACFTLGLAGAANAAPAEYAPASDGVSVMGAPSGCSYGGYPGGWQAECDKSNGGHYKATVTCRPWNGGGLVIRNAPVWRASGISIVYCPPSSSVVEGGIITKTS
ncbi:MULTISPECIES: hypothetical protein [Streptomyces]|uniref:hypothetical protein n=1 Tax=Streptomyces TaxID=1883 RepID=UPI00117CE2BF|nr:MULTISPECIES: hypothetical protein [Streptomyces]